MFPLPPTTSCPPTASPSLPERQNLIITDFISPCQLFPLVYLTTNPAQSIVISSTGHRPRRAQTLSFSLSLCPWIPSLASDSTKPISFFFSRSLTGRRSALTFFSPRCHPSDETQRQSATRQSSCVALLLPNISAPSVFFSTVRVVTNASSFRLSIFLSVRTLPSPPEGGISETRPRSSAAFQHLAISHQFAAFFSPVHHHGRGPRPFRASNRSLWRCCRNQPSASRAWRRALSLDQYCFIASLLHRFTALSLLSLCRNYSPQSTIRLLDCTPWHLFFFSLRAPHLFVSIDCAFVAIGLGLVLSAILPLPPFWLDHLTQRPIRLGHYTLHPVYHTQRSASALCLREQPCPSILRPRRVPPSSPRSRPIPCPEHHLHPSLPPTPTTPTSTVAALFHPQPRHRPCRRLRIALTAPGLEHPTPSTA